MTDEQPKTSSLDGYDFINLTTYRNNGRVVVEPSDRRGNALGGTLPGAAQILPAVEGQRANRALTRKYGWQKRMFDLMFTMRRAEQVFLEIRLGDL